MVREGVGNGVGDVGVRDGGHCRGCDRLPQTRLAVSPMDIKYNVETYFILVKVKDLVKASIVLIMSTM